MGDFKLSAQLLGHDSDVRGVSFPTPDTVFSASRDTTVRMWKRKRTAVPSAALPGASASSSAAPVYEPHVLAKGSDFVNSLTYLPPGPNHKDGLVISGGRDTIVDVRRPTSAPGDNAERLLVGHAHNVCTLDVSPQGGYVVSGGWDGQARVWSVGRWATEMLLGGHGAKAVWAVLAWDERTVVTGCADNNIRVFDLRAGAGKGEGAEVEPTATIYTPDVVRALCRVPKNHPSGADVASASNDGIIRLWNLKGQQLAELHGHDSFIYSLAALPSGELVSSGEDRTVRVWKGDVCVQTITHPAISVWCVAACKTSGDIVSGASDGVVRVFTRSEARYADQETTALFEESVRASAIPQQQVGGINKEKLPGPDFLKTKSGTREGQVQMINEDNGSVTAHQWSMSQQKWINVGTVVDSAASSGKKVEYNGKQYDFVFDVDIEDGKPALKLPYNLSENPYQSATKFLGDNNLPLTYLDSVANFIRENTAGATLGQSSGPSGPDPFGSESRYRPGGEQAAAATDAPPKPAGILPQTQYLTILAAKYEPVFNKLTQLNATLLSTGRKEHALNPVDVRALNVLRHALEHPPADPSEFPTLAATKIVLGTVVSQWPYGDRLAGLDLARVVVGVSGDVALWTEARSDRGVIELVVAAALPDEEKGDNMEGFTGKVNENMVMMALRAVANLFNTSEGRVVAGAEVDRSIAFMERVAGIPPPDAMAVDPPLEPIGRMNRNVLAALATAALNYAVLAAQDPAQVSASQRGRLARVLGRGVLHGQSDSEVVYRGLVALGTLLSVKGALEDPADAESAKTWVAEAKAKVKEQRVQNVAAECAALLP